MEKRPRAGLANILYTQRREKRTGKKNGSSDLVDLGTFRLIRRSSEESAWFGVRLALQDNEVSVYIRACTIRAFQSRKEEELPSANFQLGK